MSKIGIFDSGVGGLTIARAISDLLPNEQIIYFGDSAHSPYGNKPFELVREYSKEITKFLIKEKKCDCIIIACHTASAAAYEYLRDSFKGTPIISVIDPVVEYLVTDDSIKKIGIIATATTVNSGSYQEKLTRRKSSLLYSILPTPLLAPMIEEGFYKGAISKEIIHNYLAKPQLAEIDTLVLACTHYPLIKQEIAEYYTGRIKIIDATNIVADKVKKILEKEGLISTKRESPDEYYISEYKESFEKNAEIFFGKPVHLELKEI
ncbi:glutamate racemase [Candidatus Nomurabacteria bacterium RIFCSPHIGHO2_02_FULL_33_12]|uniref:Glutamate racemase n=1 Tax=Candidatus Nomurabacteria bacterium RIFCSPLOWO2_01_FULL_33_17 TaxID=1801764 RepID=A0A1F6WQQ2_9BACT|nr:MAG: glutamate racemase [Candidatus Nomurabacteria bacterium RIFCSPHIGHO2_02_FULL_33_12]OGI84242.1 MAG: glutamate racemase [Candidatus Nomurabacteria bacterium RIFCSPLOWO2_01_FULL_33_17]